MIDWQHFRHQKSEGGKQKKKNYSKLSVSTPLFEQVNTAAGSFAASASEKQDEGTAADTHQVQPAVALQMAWSAMASQEAPLDIVSAHVLACAVRAESAIKHHRSKETNTERVMGVVESRNGGLGMWRKATKKKTCVSPREF